ncbi:MAG TPA: OB-fold nucleic acid binding domain-containing protein [Methylocella sp.]|nr:OB-fold nucleic acid binding domain-containing protein [Methylocella sp.]
MIAAVLFPFTARPAASAGIELCHLSGDAGEALHGKVAAVDERLDLLLDDGQKLKIVGVDPPRPTPQTPDLDLVSRGRLALWLTNRTIFFRLADQNIDRWDRRPAFVYASVPAGANPQGHEWLSVGEALLDAGLGRYEADIRASPCRDQLLAAEARARKAKLGLWSDPYYAVLSATDPSCLASLSEKAGTVVLVKGRIRNVTGRKPRIMLELETGRDWNLSVAIYAGGKSFEAFHAALSDLAGRYVLVRGLLDVRYGPQIELSHPDDIDVVDQDDGRPASSPSVHQ